MRLDRATSEQLASLPAIAYDSDKVSAKVEDGQGNTYVAVMFKRPRRVEIFLIVPGDGPLDAAGVSDEIIRMVEMQELEA